LVALGLMFVPPVLLFSLGCYLAEELRFTRLSERLVLPLMLWMGFVIFAGMCLSLSVWAARHLRDNFRSMVINRDLPETRRARWRTNGRVILRLAAGFAAAVLLCTAGGYLYLANQNSRSNKRWAEFTKAHRPSLNLAHVLPPISSDAENLAAAPAFQALLSAKPQEKFRSALPGLVTEVDRFINYTPGDPTVPWIRHSPLSLGELLAPAGRNLSSPVTNAAITVLERMNSLQTELDSIGRAANERSAFIPQTTRDRNAVLAPSQPELRLLETLHRWFTVRACARIEAGDPAGAAADTLTALRLTSLAGQSLDHHASLRMQTLAGRSIQPVWEGLANRVWNESQLAAIQSELRRVDLLATFTTNVQRIVLAHMELWEQFGHTSGFKPLTGATTYRSTDKWQPRGWWLDSAIELHRIGGELVASVNPKTGAMSAPNYRGSLYELPLDYESQQLLQQQMWGANLSSVAYAQTAVNQAIVACALERHRLAHGEFPAALEALVPGVLPHLPPDVLRGRSLFYDRTNATYTLRGVGPDLRDGRGQSGSDDWVWSFGTNTPAIN
jgi:hypothetical protein